MQRFRQVVVAMVLCWMALCAMVLDGATLARRAVPGGCLRTPSEAIAAAAAGASHVDDLHGFRLASVRWDSLQGQAWAVIQSCEHPERPTMSLRTTLPADRGLRPASAPLQTAAPLPIIRTGEVVRLWRNDGEARIELTATSEESGEVGTRIRVLLLRQKDQDGLMPPPQYRAGVVRGPADVELEP